MGKEAGINKKLAEQLHTGGAGYDILRYICIPDLLGKDANTILYIMGKNLARKMKPESIDEILEYFNLFGWGDLRVEKEKRREIIFELAGPVVKQRFKTIEEVEYRLEAGFLAASLEQEQNVACECFSEVKPKKNTVQFNAVYMK